jgi:hypothetical protein
VQRELVHAPGPERVDARYCGTLVRQRPCWPSSKLLIWGAVPFLKAKMSFERRPQLAAALAEARVKKCPVVAKLDRLSRDVAFVAGLMAQRVPFIVAELGGHRLVLPDRIP